MTVETQLTLVYYEGDGIAVTFPFTFPVFDESHLQVMLENPVTYAQTVLGASEYSVAGIGNENGGSVTTLVAPVVGMNLLLARILPLQQDLDVDNQGGFYPNNFERQLDITEMQIQQLNEEQNRSVRGQIGEIWPELPGPPARRGQLLAFTDDETAYPTVDSTAALFNLISNVLQAGFGISLTLDPVNHTITITNTEPGDDELQECWLLENAVGGSEPGVDIEAEFVRDTMGIALHGLGCVIVVDDVADTITIDCTQAPTAEVIRDVIGAALVAGTGISIAVSDAGDTITITATGGGGSFQPLSTLLTGLAAVSPTAANQLIFSTGVDTFDKTSLSPFMRTLLDDTSAAAALVTLGAIAAGVGSFGPNVVSVSIPIAGGNLLIQGGKGTISSNTNSQTLTFPTPFSMPPVCLVSGGSADASHEGDVHTAGLANNGSIVICNSRDATVVFNWLAIGLA